MMLEAVTWALCPHIRQAECKQCPATVATEYGDGKQVCRGLAEDAARAAIEALREPSEAMCWAVPLSICKKTRVKRAATWRYMIDAILAEPTP